MNYIKNLINITYLPLSFRFCFHQWFYFHIGIEIPKFFVRYIKHDQGVITLYEDIDTTYSAIIDVNITREFCFVEIIKNEKLAGKYWIQNNTFSVFSWILRRLIKFFVRLFLKASCALIKANIFKKAFECIFPVVLLSDLVKSYVLLLRFISMADSPD